MSRAVGALLLACLANCSTTLSQAGKDVQLMKGDPPTGCTEAGPVTGESTMADDLDSAKNDMRNKAAAMGANYVRMEVAAGSQIKGTAFRCADRSAAPR